MATPWTPAYVLHQRPFRDQSVVLELLTQDVGRLGAVYHRGRGRKAPPLAFVPGEWQLSGRGDLRTAYGFQTGSGQPLAGQALFAGLYINELLLRLFPREAPAEGLFEAYGEALDALRLAPVAEPVILRRLEWACLEALGLAFSLTEDSSGEALRPGGAYRFEAGVGLLASASGQGWAGAELLALAEGDFSTPALRHLARALFSAALAPALGGRSLQGVRFLSDPDGGMG
ncbi:MAG: DNA repair protein RecO C-terminal domain-containing protein [Pseudomonadales bacterium]|nr:DNA repair protein RecO C-terminal domain-containing protein [Pseudomonadales bacterium]